MPTETTKVFTSLEDALKEVVKWMVPKSTGANIQIAGKPTLFAA
jgi:hypothetical protein